jgi:hypothetical protein
VQQPVEHGDGDHRVVVEDLSPRIWIPRLVVRAMPPFKYLRLTTWKSALAASRGSGR